LSIGCSHNFNTWRKIKNEVRSTCVLNGLKNRTISQYLKVYDKFEKSGFHPEENCFGYKRIMKWLIGIDSKAKNIYISAVRKAAKVCFPGAPISYAKIKLKPNKKKWLSYNKAIEKIKSMIKNNDKELAVCSLFLIITGSNSKSSPNFVI